MISNTIYVISVDDEKYISETVKETFGCGSEYTGSELRPSLTHSILESKRFYSEGGSIGVFGN